MSVQDNFKLMCTNAMIYNKPDTIYYKAAKKLLHSGMKILSQVIENTNQNTEKYASSFLIPLSFHFSYRNFMKINKNLLNTCQMVAYCNLRSTLF